MAPDPFARLVHFYELDEGRYSDDLGLYVGLAERWGDPVLEVGCGTGRVLRSLADAGHRGVGIDSSQAMLDVAQQKLHGALDAGQVRLSGQDMRTFQLGEQFAWAFLAMNSLMHLVTLEDQLAALRRIREHLRLNGRLVLDLANPDPVWLMEPSEQIVRVGVLDDPHTGQTIVRQVLRRVDTLRQLLHLTYMYDVVDADGSLHRVMVPISLRFMFPVEAQLLLERAGFEVAEILGTYDLDPFGGADERMILICEAR